MPISSRPGPAAKMPKNIARTAARMGLAVGFFGNTKYPDGTPVAYVASVHEFGLGVPQRAFMRPTVDAQQNAWTNTVIALLKGKKDPHSALTIMGGMVQGDIQKAIATLSEPKLSDATLYSRTHRKNPPPNKSKKPLVDTRYMLPSVQYEVFKK